METSEDAGTGDIQSGGGRVIEIETKTEHSMPLALEAVIVAARPRLLRLARLRGAPPDAAEDVVQETLLEAWRCLDRLYDPTGVDRWLDEICRNICRRYARKQATEQRNLAFSAPGEDEEQRASETVSLENLADSEASDPIEALNRQDMALLLDQALGLLPGNAREVVELCYLRELPQREATDRLGLSLSALEARLHRARRQLRALFNGPLRPEAEALGLALDDASEQGWRDFLAAHGGSDWVVLHGGATAVFRVKSMVEAARLAEALGQVSGLNGAGVLMTIADGQLTVRLTRGVFRLEERHVRLAQALSAVARLTSI